MPPTPANQVVSCGIRWNANTLEYHVKATVQQATGSQVKYVKYHTYVTTWAQALTWFAALP